jgi:hypothetical protein
MDSKKKKLLAASVAGLLAVTGVVASTQKVFAQGVKCSGINACKGLGEDGTNACKGQGWVTSASADECVNAGGTVVPEELAA